MQAGINPNTDFKFRYSESHLATAAMVETGVVDAGAVDESVFNFLIINGKLNRKKVRIFYTSEPYVAYVYVARKDVPEAERERFVRALLALTEDKDHPVLETLRATQFVARQRPGIRTHAADGARIKNVLSQERTALPSNSFRCTQN
jgi:phosphonate transport system substrate-binding protein